HLRRLGLVRPRAGRSDTGAELPRRLQDRLRTEILRGPPVACRKDHRMAHPAGRLAPTRDHRAVAVGDGRGDGERGVRCGALSPPVIPGRRKAASPGSMATNGSGLESYAGDLAN